MGKCALLAIAALLVSGCASAVEEAAIEAMEPDPGQTLRMALGPGWSDDERAAVQGALSEWRVASNGKVNVVIVSGDADATLFRGAVDPATGYYAWSRKGRYVRIDADAFAADGYDLRTGVGATTAHAVGRMLQMPIHDGQGVLSTSGATYPISPNDLASCRSVEWC